ncbi:MAG: MFS transporter [Streptosporangiaceae bacterium]
MLGFAPFPMHLDTHQLGIAFTGWGVLVAIFAVFGAPRLQARFGIARTLYANLALFALDIAIFTSNQAVLIGAVVATGIFIGVNNTITTQAVMTVAPVERSVAAAAYGFVRFIGGGLAPYVAGRMAERWGVHVPSTSGRPASSSRSPYCRPGTGCSGWPSKTRPPGGPLPGPGKTAIRPRRWPRNSGRRPDPRLARPGLPTAPPAGHR